MICGTELVLPRVGAVCIVGMIYCGTYLLDWTCTCTDPAQHFATAGYDVDDLSVDDLSVDVLSDVFYSFYYT